MAIRRTVRTTQIWVDTAVTCPTFRYNSAVVAEAFVSIHSGQADPARGIDFYGREVLPHLKRSLED